MLIQECSEKSLTSQHSSASTKLKFEAVLSVVRIVAGCVGGVSGLRLLHYFADRMAFARFGILRFEMESLQHFRSACLSFAQQKVKCVSPGRVRVTSWSAGRCFHVGSEQAEHDRGHHLYGKDNIVVPLARSHSLSKPRASP